MIKRLCNPLRRMFMAMLVLWAASTLNAVAADQSAVKPAEEAIKVVYHADFADPRRFSAMLSNIHNMVSTYQSELKEYDVRIVFVSYGIRFVTQDKLTGTPFAEDPVLKQRRAELLTRLATLRDNEGVKLELCDITREAVHLPREKVISGVTLVPSGVVRIAELQHQGYAYLKVE
ncbi:MAG: DsrE family protein [Sulfuricaulis sp.]|uniref:DsrE family protein n=1 Tax=Sulfuricaulis sp. TaxID=2003553 RepID=UPI003C39A3C6